MRNARMPFVDEGHCITKGQQAFVSIHGGIPCNLAPAHFTVHVVQVRLNFALGFVVEANPASEIHSLSCVFFGFGFLFHTG